MLYPRHLRLGLIEATANSYLSRSTGIDIRGIYASASLKREKGKAILYRRIPHIRGIYASASLKPQLESSDHFLCGHIRGIYASASLKPVKWRPRNPEGEGDIRGIYASASLKLPCSSPYN